MKSTPSPCPPGPTASSDKVCVYCGQEGHRSHACPRRLRLGDLLAGAWIGLILLLMLGCSTPSVVHVPVPVRCLVDLPAPPEYRFFPPYSDSFTAVKHLLGDRVLSDAYADELRLALESCR